MSKLNESILKGFHKKLNEANIQDLYVQTGLSENDVEKIVNEAVKEYAKEINGKVEIPIDSYELQSIEEDKEFLKAIYRSSGSAKDTAFEQIDEWYRDAEVDAIYDITTAISEIVANKLGISSDEVLDYGELRDLIDDLAAENISVEIPYDKILDKCEINMVAINSYELYSNSLKWEEKDGEEQLVGVDKEIEEFIKSQGYTVEQFIEAWNTDKKGGFLGTLCDEINETINNGNEGVLVFLARVPLRTAIDMMDAERDNKSVEVSDDSMCGIVNFGDGSGGTLEINLAKNYKITNLKNWDFVPDDVLTYGIDRIYGLTGSAWERGNFFVE